MELTNSYLIYLKRLRIKINIDGMNTNGTIFVQMFDHDHNFYMIGDNTFTPIDIADMPIDPNVLEEIEPLHISKCDYAKSKIENLMTNMEWHISMAKNIKMTLDQINRKDTA